jgi:Glycosyl transferase family group 2
MGCANGEVAPFVGHNAFLRWSALQDAQFVDPADDVSKIWSESNVSEDFDMALRLQVGDIRCVLPSARNSPIYTIAQRIHYPMGYVLRRWL